MQMKQYNNDDKLIDRKLILYVLIPTFKSTKRQHTVHVIREKNATVVKNSKHK